MDPSTISSFQSLSYWRPSIPRNNCTIPLLNCVAPSVYIYILLNVSWLTEVDRQGVPESTVSLPLVEAADGADDLLPQPDDDAGSERV